MVSLGMNRPFSGLLHSYCCLRILSLSHSHSLSLSLSLSLIASELQFILVNPWMTNFHLIIKVGMYTW